MCPPANRYFIIMLFRADTKVGPYNILDNNYRVCTILTIFSASFNMYNLFLTNIVN